MIQETNEDSDRQFRSLLGSLGEVYEKRKLQILKSFSRVRREYRKDGAGFLIGFGTLTVSCALGSQLSGGAWQGTCGIGGLGTLIISLGAFVGDRSRRQLASVEVEKRKSEKELVESDVRSTILKHAWLYGLPGLAPVDALRMIVSGEGAGASSALEKPESRNLIAQN